MLKTDILVVGGGIIGLNMARILSSRGKVTLIDKDTCGAHASGRNSAVVHAGVYYTPGSLKAKHCVRGNKLLKAFCEEHGILCKHIGKIIAPKDSSELSILDDLYERSTKNEASVKIIDYKEAKEIEPRLKQQEYFLWSPTTSIADNMGIIRALKEQCTALGVDIQENTAFVRKLPSEPREHLIETSRSKIACKFFVNCGGIYSDKIAHSFGFGMQYEMLPFIGLYLMGSPTAPRLNTLVYPCPLGKYEFLGVHTTNRVDGAIKLGPTATPALWRQQYSGFSNFSFSESVSSLKRYVQCLLSSDRGLYLKLLSQEIRKFNKKNVVSDASDIVSGMQLSDYQQWGPRAIYPQLVDRKTSSLVPDFKSDGDDLSFHFLNIVSPGWTSSFSITKEVCENLNLK